MSRTADLNALACEMRAAQAAGRQIEPFTARVDSFDLAAAYEVAQAVHHARCAEGAVPVGRKIGFTNPDMWASYGVGAPVWAYMYETTVEHVVGGQAVCDLTPFAEPKIEPEIVFRLRTMPPVGSDPAAILACIDWVAQGFEIVQSHYPGWKFRAADTVADAALHGRLLIGEPLPIARLGADAVAALERFSLTLCRGGELREIGQGRNVLGNPLAALAHLVAVLAQQPQYEPLQAGEIVTTGTVTLAYPVAAGEIWRSDIEGVSLPRLSVEFVAGARDAARTAGAS